MIWPMSGQQLKLTLADFPLEQKKGHLRLKDISQGTQCVQNKCNEVKSRPMDGWTLILVHAHVSDEVQSVAKVDAES